MRNARIIVALGFAALATGACKQQPAQDQNISIDAGEDNQIAGNADIYTLPPDESSTTPTNELQNGIDAPDANAAGNADNSY